jgi:hypothetical protein
VIETSDAISLVLFSISAAAAAFTYRIRRLIGGI